MQNKALVLSFYKAFDNRRLRDGLSLLSPMLTAHIAGKAQSLTQTEFADLGTEVYNAFPDGRHVFTQAIAHKDTVTTCGYFTGTHLDTFQGIPATGKTVRFSVMHIDRVSHSKIVEHWGMGDSLSMVQQLGVKLVPGPGLMVKMGVKAGRHLTDDAFGRLRAVTQPDHYPQIPEY
ncbi:MAG: ester cyclase [Phormidesmis sp.]